MHVQEPLSVLLKRCESESTESYIVVEKRSGEVIGGCRGEQSLCV